MCAHAAHPHTGPLHTCLPACGGPRPALQHMRLALMDTRECTAGLPAPASSHISIYGLRAKPRLIVACRAPRHASRCQVERIREMEVSAARLDEASKARRQLEAERLELDRMHAERLAKLRAREEEMMEKLRRQQVGWCPTCPGVLALERRCTCSCKCSFRMHSDI